VGSQGQGCSESGDIGRKKDNKGRGKNTVPLPNVWGHYNNLNNRTGGSLVVKTGQRGVLCGGFFVLHNLKEDHPFNFSNRPKDRSEIGGEGGASGEVSCLSN